MRASVKKVNILSWTVSYASLENGMAIQYPIKNNEYPKDLISAEDITKNHRHDDSGTIKTDHKTSKHENPKKQKKSREKEE